MFHWLAQSNILCVDVKFYAHLQGNCIGHFSSQRYILWLSKNFKVRPLHGRSSVCKIPDCLQQCEREIQKRRERVTHTIQIQTNGQYKQVLTVNTWLNKSDAIPANNIWLQHCIISNTWPRGIVCTGSTLVVLYPCTSFVLHRQNQFGARQLRPQL